jgi:cephalosporin hydroxylase
MMNKKRFYELYESTQKIHQSHEEFWEFLEVIAPIAPQRILEMGTAHGGTALIFQEIGTQVISVDNKGISGEIPMEMFNPEVTTFLTADTHDPATLAQVKEMMPEVDMLFIDGDHTYPGALQDWEMYSPLVRPGGLIIFHDIAYGRLKDPDSEIKAGKVFDEVRGDLRVQEIFVEHGIGILWV